MLTIEYPALAPEIRLLPMGIAPIVLRNPDAAPKLIVKSSKETLLTAKVNSGFKIYVIPVLIEGQQTFGLISAFFDTDDEPLIIYTPLFEDPVMLQLVNILQGPNLDCHLFDEHSRELLGYACDLVISETVRKQLEDAQFPPFKLESAQSAHNQMQLWFSARTAYDDRQAIDVRFRESLFPDDLFILDLQHDNHRFPGGASFTFSELERQEPGSFQEHDIARLLQRLFAAEYIFMNPRRVTDGEEIADILVITEWELIIVQAKDSPNIERVLRNTIARKKRTTEGALTKAVNQAKGALRYLRSDSPVVMKIGTGTMTLNISELELRCLIIVKELFNDEFDKYSQLLLDVFKETNVPCIALDYPELASYTSGLSTDRFFEALDFVFSHGLRTGTFPRLRIWSFPESDEMI